MCPLRSYHALLGHWTGILPQAALLAGSPHLGSFEPVQPSRQTPSPSDGASADDAPTTRLQPSGPRAALQAPLQVAVGSSSLYLKMLFGIIACTPLVPSTASVTLKSTAALHNMSAHSPDTCSSL